MLSCRTVTASVDSVRSLVELFGDLHASAAADSAESCGGRVGFFLALLRYSAVAAGQLFSGLWASSCLRELLASVDYCKGEASGDLMTLVNYLCSYW